MQHPGVAHSHPSSGVGAAGLLQLEKPELQVGEHVPPAVQLVAEVLVVAQPRPHAPQLVAVSVDPQPASPPDPDPLLLPESSPASSPDPELLPELPELLPLDPDEPPEDDVPDPPLEPLDDVLLPDELPLELVDPLPELLEPLGPDPPMQT
jgi:hypothetical protein